MIVELFPVVPKRKNSGQSLVEVLVAMTVILMVIVGIIVATVYATRNSDFSKNQALATKLAQEKMEQVRSDRDQDPDAFFILSSSETEPPIIGIFTRQTTYSPATCPGDDCGKKTEVKVTVSWTDQTGTHQANQSSIFTKWQEQE